MRPLPGQIRGSALKVLLVVLESADQGHLPTIREIARALGWTGHNYVVDCLGILEREGLIVRERGYGSARTIRPVCRLALFREVE